MKKSEYEQWEDVLDSNNTYKNKYPSTYPSSLVFSGSAVVTAAGSVSIAANSLGWGSWKGIFRGVGS